MSEHRPEPEVTPLPRPRDDRCHGRLDGVVAIVTGADSGIGRGIAAEFARAAVAREEVRRAGLPWEVGRLAVDLASSDADYVHGTTFTIDGGLEQMQGQGA